MRKIIIYFFKVIKVLTIKIRIPCDFLFTWILFYSNGILFSSFISNGLPRINVNIKGKCSFGKNFSMNNCEIANPIGRVHHCIIVVGPKGILSIGNNVGISSTTIICQDKIVIGNNGNYLAAHAKIFRYVG